jgi:hypothetical protein
MRASCCCSSDSDRCSLRCARTTRWLSARRAAELIRLSNSGRRSATAAISAATATPISESRSSPTRGRARISSRRSRWRGWRLSPARRALQRFRSVSLPGVESGSDWTPPRRPGKHLPASTPSSIHSGQELLARRVGPRARDVADQRSFLSRGPLSSIHLFAISTA